jgi:hypothetical protein
MHLKKNGKHPETAVQHGVGLAKNIAFLKCGSPKRPNNLNS